MNALLKPLLLITLFFTTIPVLKAQEALKQKPSPLGLVTYKFDSTYIKVTYGRPHLRSREAFKEDSPLAPVGKIWRTGANEATEITLTKDALLAGNRVRTGTYTIFSIPGAKEWTIILNKDLGQWGAYEYDDKLDYIKFQVPSREIDESYEPFTITFDQTEGKVAMQMIWANTLVSIPIEFISE